MVVFSFDDIYKHVKHENRHPLALEGDDPLVATHFQISAAERNKSFFLKARYTKQGPFNHGREESPTFPLPAKISPMS